MTHFNDMTNLIVGLSYICMHMNIEIISDTDTVFTKAI